MFDDPAFWIAVGVFVVIGYLFIWALCAAAARGDRQASRARYDVETERRRLEALNRAARMRDGGGGGWRK